MQDVIAHLAQALTSKASKSCGRSKNHLIRIPSSNNLFFAAAKAGIPVEAKQGMLVISGDFCDLSGQQLMNGVMDGEVFKLPTPHALTLRPNKHSLTIKAPRQVTTLVRHWHVATKLNHMCN